MLLSLNVNLIKALPGNHLLLLPDAPKFTMIAASEEYFVSSHKTADELFGIGLFDAFPEDPENSQQGRIDLINSFEKVIKEKKKDKLPPIRHDLELNGKFVERYWRNENSPVLDDEGNLIYIVHTAEDVTEKVKADQTEELVKGMGTAQNIFNQTPVAICILKGPDLVVESANEPTLELWGRGKYVIGKRLIDAVPEVVGQPYVGIITEVLMTGQQHEVYESPVWLIRDGKEDLCYINYVYQPYYEDGKTIPVGVLAIGNDVTERVVLRQELAQKNESLKDSNEKLSSFLEAVPQIVWTNTPDGQIDFYNQQWFKYTGLNYQQSKEWGWQEVIHPDDLPSSMSVYIEGLQKGEEIVTENRFRRHDGEYRWHLSRAVPIKDTKGIIMFWMGTSTDIHDRKLIEEALTDSEFRYRTLIEEATIATGLFVGSEMKILYANDIMFSYWGKDKDILGKPLHEGIPELVGQPFLKLLDDVYTTGIPYIGKEAKAILVKNGTPVECYFNYTYKPLRNNQGEIYGIYDIAIDVTSEVLAKQALQQSEQNLRNIILQAPVAMCLFKGKEHIIDIANEKMFELMGKQSVEVLHKPLFEGMPEVRDQGFEQILDNVYATGETYAANAVPAWLLRNGTSTEVYTNFVHQPFRSSNGEILGIMTVSVDVTEQVIAHKKIEEVVAQRTKELAEANFELVNTNASLEQFAYAASHDMQEPLRKIMTFSSLLERETGALSDAGKSLLGKVNSSANRMKNIIHDMLQFSSHKTSDASENVDLDEVIAQVKSDLEITITEKDVWIQAEHLPSINAIKGQLNQLFYNLISNSIKFAKRDTQPHIQINSAPALHEEIAARQGLNTNKEYTKITIEDNGIGFEQHYADKIFQLFSRLHGKAQYEGTGIGLGVCKKIVQNHFGDIYATSEEGKGATFTIILPIT